MIHQHMRMLKAATKMCFWGCYLQSYSQPQYHFSRFFFKIYSKHCTTLERTCVLTGAIGVTNTMFIVPFILLQPVLGLGPVEFPTTLDTVILVLYIGILAFFYNFFYMTGISVMGPLKSKYRCVNPNTMCQK